MTELIRKELINSTFMYCYRRLGNTADAEDLAQDILCEALSGLGKGRTIENFDAWYWTLAHNKLCIYLRKKKYSAAPLDEHGGIITDLPSLLSRWQRSILSPCQSCLSA